MPTSVSNTRPRSSLASFLLSSSLKDSAGISDYLLFLSPFSSVRSRFLSPLVYRLHPHRLFPYGFDYSFSLTMGKAGRFACIFVPYALTFAVLICIIVLGLSCTDSHSSTLTDIYMFRVSRHTLPRRRSLQSQVVPHLFNVLLTLGCLPPC